MVRGLPAYPVRRMQTVLERLPDHAHIAVIRLRSLGDCVLTTPALDILKQSRPDLRVAVVVEDRFAPVFEGNDSVAALLPPSIPALREWQPRLCLNLHGGSRSAEHLASAIFYLGARSTQIPRARLSGVTRANSKPYAVIHPIASQPAKTWPAARFLEVAAYLDMEPVFIAGPGEDLSAFRKYRTLAGAPLAEIKNLLANASLFVGNDSGPAHMAAAFGLPVVVLFGSSNVDVWRPWKTSSEVLSSPDGIASVSVEQVM